MEELIKKYYKITNITNYKTYYNIICFMDNKKSLYILESIQNRKYIIDIYKELINNTDYTIIKNIYGNSYTNIYGIDYILIKCNKIRYNPINNQKKIYNLKANNSLNKINWIYLWIKKIDYYEYQQKHIKDYKFLIDSLNYYLGMGEIAVNYIKYNLRNTSIPLVISHKRISKDNLYNPENIILDYRARDVSQYLKYLFFETEYRYFNFDKFLKMTNFTRDDYILLYGRLLFPCFYFDLYDEIVNSSLNQKDIIKIISRSEEYEAYVDMIYNKIIKITHIPKIDWINN
ncbi:MAG: hypothetical protein IJF92_04220 [Bacilli bacterium]|nr:hypothetical protein [Bacilli bacterium]